MIAWHQSTGNNIETEQWVTPNYNQKCGWAEGAQTDIFEGGAAPTPTASANSTLPTSTPVEYSSTAAPDSPTSVASYPTTFATVVAPSSISVVVKDYSTSASPVEATSAPAPAAPTSCTKHHYRHHRPTAWAAM
jgi:hypothetical protein